MTIVNGRFTSEVGRPTLLGRGKTAKVTITDSSTVLTEPEREQLVAALDLLANSNNGKGYASGIVMTDPTVWAVLRDRFKGATRVRFEITREIG